jgi:hypothetical protein
VTTYAYLNAVLAANPTIVALVLTPEVYAVAVGDVPAGEASIPGRVALSLDAAGVVVNFGYDAANTLVVQFIA